jgi:hypothetical protein
LTLGISSLASADPLVGDVGAAYSTAEGAGVNPANAAFLDRTQAMFVPEIFKTESLSVRYPGFEPTTVSDNGLGSILSAGRPSFIFKPNSRFGIGGYLIPPVGIEVEIHKQKIPVVVLGQQSFVDLDAVGRPDVIGQAIMGYRFTDRLGVGLNLGIQAISFDATLTPSDGSDPLATVKGSQSDINTAVGARYEAVPGKLALGVAFGLVNIHKQSMTIDSSLLSTASGEDSAAAGDDGGETETTTPLNQIVFGFQAGLGSRLRLLGDFYYPRADKSGQSFSLVDLKQKTRDVHDTLAVRAGIIAGLTDAANATLGFRYEPASLGAGTKGDDGLAGFGTIEVVEIFTGLAPMVPFWQVSGGIQSGFSPRAMPRSKKDKDEARGYYQWLVGTGIVYRRASLGIDENGELPGAYLYKKVSIPVSVTYKF